MPARPHTRGQDTLWRSAVQLRAYLLSGTLARCRANVCGSVARAAPATGPS
jgi:hypothetical protein